MVDKSCVVSLTRYVYYREFWDFTEGQKESIFSFSGMLLDFPGCLSMMMDHWETEAKDEERGWVSETTSV